jgi:hypothetical protein
MNITGIEINRKTVFAFFADPKTQATIRAWIVAPSGWFAVHAAKWLGVDTSQLGEVATWAIYLAPYAVVYAWSIAQKTQAAIVAQAGIYLAKKQQGSIVINVSAPAALQKVASDEAQSAVNAAVPAAAKQAAAGT